ncbi:telomeric repeat-binding factor 2-interacting protein 1 isoform X1 [Notolabrus celidotus]|uniref:telomeric repeat-binding factor 2-interacting protein 1 isoform X1 n=1 Tax=Notolabrus celidotus TaxID=1203425 RepID=UPI00148FA8E3|nr:telomeric repeat-binding factor 2-interacting protein 1 isoform X1 [Notolabrus celidotus]
MPSKQQDVAKSNISPVLFMSLDGEPMSFYLRPSLVKRELQPLITAGGGLLCNTQQPGAILLLDPGEKGSITQATAHRYISTQYIRDCVEKDEQLDVEDYRLSPEDVPNQSAKLNSSREGSAAFSGGRAAYTSEEDAAIMKFVSKHKSEVGGNRLWQEMEKLKVTSHSWQSMKYRYRVRLSKTQSDAVEEKIQEEETEAAEEEIKVEENQETDVEKPSSAEDAPSTHSAESDLTQIDPQSVAADSKQLDIFEAQMPISLQEEEVSTQIEEQLAESTEPETEEAETSTTPLEDSVLNSQTNFHLSLPESLESETQEQHIVSFTQKECVPEDSPAAHSVSQDASCQEKPKEKRKPEPEPEPEQLQRRLTRRQLQLDDLLGPEPYGKKLRSSSSSVSSSPRLLRKIKPGVRSAFWRDTTAEQPPSKRARGKGAAAVQDSEAAMQESAAAEPESEVAMQESEAAVQESEAAVQESEAAVQESEAAVQESAAAEPESEVAMQESEAAVQESEAAVQEIAAVLEVIAAAVQESAAAVQGSRDEESGPANVKETTKPDAESISVPQKEGKKKEKRKLGILEAATKEFEDDSESDGDESPDLQNQTKIEKIKPTSSDPPSNTAADPSSTQSHSGSVPGLQEVVPETQSQASTSNFPPETVCPQHATSTPAAPVAINATSKPHLFIFDNESQEEDSQSIISKDRVVPSKMKETVIKGSPYSLTQAQLEEDKRRVTELMKQTNQDLFSVTKALLRTSGDFSAALNLLLNPGCISGPFWDRHDDNLLLSADPEVRQQLQEKHGEEALVKRVLFLEVEG